MILSCKQGRNEDVFPGILELYAPMGAKIADVTYGNGAFWKKVDAAKYRLFPTDMKTGVDFRKLPYGDGEMDMVVLDPPYIYNPSKTVKASISSSYNVNGTNDLRTNQDIINLYAGGVKEARRVLKAGGFLVMKCQDVIESGKSKWNHMTLHDIARAEGFFGEDLFVLMQQTTPCIRWKEQKHARKNHSYFWILRKT